LTFLAARLAVKGRDAVPTTRTVSLVSRDRVPDGFYLDHKTCDLTLLHDIEEVQHELLGSSTVGPTPKADLGLDEEARLPPCRHKRPGKVIRILLVEDNPGDARLIREALVDTRVRHRLTVVENGVRALARLRSQGEHAGTPLPHLILLDLNLPLKDGRQLLEDIKSDTTLKHIPVVVLTASQAQCDRLKTDDLGATGYIEKPIARDQLIAVVQLLQASCLHIGKALRLHKGV
jgi:chemotaxis family two-component system response regulator Rcp1